jgi:GNAT superfamily N-acetyltransferase
VPADCDVRYTVPTPINSSHALASFACGNQAMDSWLKKHALENEGKASRTYVVTAGSAVIAYYTLAMGCLNVFAMPKKLRQNLPNQVPVTVLGRLAVDNEHSGKGIASGLLREAMQRTLGVAEHVGVRALLVNLIDDEAGTFYKRFGFVPLAGTPSTLILPIETIASAIDETAGRSG